MPAGTIALTNNSATVTGTGTSFTTELKVNDFLVSTVGGLAYTLGVKSIESNTSLTLMEKYTGPSASGQSWTPVPYGTMAAITAQLAAQVTYAIRGFNLDKANWQQIFTGTGTVTVNLPDGTSWQGPAWSGVITALNAKANSSDVLTKADNLSSVANKSLALGNLGALPLSGGTLTGALTGVNASFSGNVNLTSASARIYLDQTSTVSIRSQTLSNLPWMVVNGGGVYTDKGYRGAQGLGGATQVNMYNFYWTGQLQAWIDTTSVGYVTLSSTSDKQLKKDIIYYVDTNKALSEVRQWRPATFKFKERGVLKESENQLGFIANDLVEVSEFCVTGKGLNDDYDELNPDSPYTLNETAMIAKLTLALQEADKLINSQDQRISDLEKRMAALDGLSN